MYRPAYPQRLFQLIKGLVRSGSQAWDCGTGNGQLAVGLSEFMQTVYATDISRSQLSKAVNKTNIKYSLTAAEKTPFPDDFFDLVTVAQAFHWFHFDHFFNEAKRVLKPEGLILLIGYDLHRIAPDLDHIIDRFYHQTLAGFWSPERRYIDNKYADVPFPFFEIRVNEIEHTVQWDLGHYLGYLSSWSAVKQFKRKKRVNPMELIQSDIENSWGKGNRDVKFRIFIRAGINRA